MEAAEVIPEVALTRVAVEAAEVIPEVDKATATVTRTETQVILEL